MMRNHRNHRYFDNVRGYAQSLVLEYYVDDLNRREFWGTLTPIGTQWSMTISILATNRLMESREVLGSDNISFVVDLLKTHIHEVLTMTDEEIVSEYLMLALVDA